MTEFDAARAQSRVFMHAALRCNEFRPVPSGALQTLFVPSLVCYAFSIEIGLKALALHEGRQVPSWHDLKRLFGLLSPGLQAAIITDTGSSTSFGADLDLVSNVFEVWRYIYERTPSLGVDTDQGFLQRFAAAVQKALSSAR